ncbi:hypothetical protein, partial [Plasmodium yoelii yoelii]
MNSANYVTIKPLFIYAI